MGGGGGDALRPAPPPRLLRRTAAGAPGVTEKFVERWSKTPWREFPGGRYKPSTNATLPGTTMSAGLFKLTPGGLRELHWHDAAEWAYVIEGECIATAVDAGFTHPTDTWSFPAGTIWYFPANIPHAISAPGPQACVFVAAFNKPDFEEQAALSASGWLGTVPNDALAQALGVDAATAARVRAATKGGKASFLPQLPAQPPGAKPDTPPLAPQFPVHIHRFPLTDSTPEVTNGDGSFIRMVDVKMFPVATDMSGALVRIAPRGMRQLHWHLGLNEWQLVLNGTVEAGVFESPQIAPVHATLGPGDLGFAPRGSGHFLRNLGDTPAYILLVFDAGTFTNVDATQFLGAFNSTWIASSLGVSAGDVGAMDFEIAGFAPAPKPSPAAS